MALLAYAAEGDLNGVRQELNNGAQIDYRWDIFFFITEQRKGTLWSPCLKRGGTWEYCSVNNETVTSYRGGWMKSTALMCGVDNGQ
eukprot:949106-Amorphochlora_amoeboformis.AAC.1